MPVSRCVLLICMKVSTPHIDSSIISSIIIPICNFDTLAQSFWQTIWYAWKESFQCRCCGRFWNGWRAIVWKENTTVLRKTGFVKSNCWVRNSTIICTPQQAEDVTMKAFFSKLNLESRMFVLLLDQLQTSLVENEDACESSNACSYLIWNLHWHCNALLLCSLYFHVLVI